VHLFDALRFITGREVARVRASRARILNPGLEDWLLAEVFMDDAVSGVVDANKASPARVGRFDFICETGILQGDHVHGILSEIRETVVAPIEVEPPGPTLPPLLRDWHDHLTGRAENPIPGTEGLEAVKICHACREAARRTEGWVELETLDGRMARDA
jgi:predicted dehydrogenase